MMHLPQFVGLGYHVLSGKDTLADYLCARYGYRKTAFADTLKSICGSVFGLTHEQLYGDRKEERLEYWSEVMGRDVTPRFLFQHVATMFRKSIHEDVWVHVLQVRVALSPDKWVIPDVHYPNEMAAIKRMGGVVWRLDREGSGTQTGIPGHESETSLDGCTEWDAILTNDATFQALYAKARELLGDSSVEACC